MEIAEDVVTPTVFAYVLSDKIKPLSSREWAWSLVIKNCPYCGEKHYHGGGAWEDNPARAGGHRERHCADASLYSKRKQLVRPNKGGYDLKVVGYTRQTPTGQIRFLDNDNIGEWVEEQRAKFADKFHAAKVRDLRMSSSSA